MSQDNTNQGRGERLADQLAKESQAQEARMLPDTGDLNSEQLDFVRRRVQMHCDENQLTFEHIDKKINCQQRAVRKFIDGVYEHDNSDLARRLDRWLISTETDASCLPRTFVSTSVALRMLGVLGAVNKRRAMGSIVGPSGVSKSTVLKAAQAGLIPGSIHVELNCTDASMTSLLRRLSADLGGPKNSATQHTMRWIIESLRGTDRMLMLDEAHYLKRPAMNALRDIHKATGCPIVLVGTQDLLQTIEDFTDFHGQFKSLMAITYNITVETNEGNNPLYTVEEIIEYAKAMKIRLDSMAAEYVTDLANTLGWGGLRSAGYLLANADTLTKGKMLTLKSIVAALHQMEGSDGLSRTKYKAETTRKVGVA